MKKVFILFFVLLMQSARVFCQENFEILIPWNMEGDVSALGLTVQQTPNNDYLLLANIQWFEEGGQGIPIEGSVTLGSGIIELSSFGQKNWQRLYSTNHYVLDEFSSRGRVPASQFILNADNEIILPYAKLTGITPCDSINSNTATVSYKKGIKKIDSQTSNIIYTEAFFEDNLCDKDKIIGIKETDFGYILLYFDDFYASPLYIEKLNTAFEVLEVDTFVNDTKWVQFSEYENSIIIASQTSFSKINYEGELLQTYGIEIEDTLFQTSIKWAENVNYYVICMTDYSYPQRVSTLYIIDKQGNTISHAFYDEKIINDVEITDNNEVLVLFDKSRNNFYDMIPQPVQVSRYNEELDLIASRDYGFPFISPADITLTNNQQGFLVTGTRFKSIDLVNGKEADQVYLLKGEIDELVSSNVEIHDEGNNITIYPNPFDKQINLKIPSLKEYSIELFNTLGKSIFKKKYQNHEPEIQVNIDEQLTSGIYYMVIRASNSLYSFKLIKL